MFNRIKKEWRKFDLSMAIDGVNAKAVIVQIGCGILVLIGTVAFWSLVIWALVKYIRS